MSNVLDIALISYTRHDQQLPLEGLVPSSQFHKMEETVCTHSHQHVASAPTPHSGPLFNIPPAVH